MTSYINRKDKVFLEKPEKYLFPTRSEARMKSYVSSHDLRVWSDIVEERRQHILEHTAKNKEGICLEKIIPIDLLFEIMMGNKNEQIKDLEDKIAALEKELDDYNSMELTEEQQQQLDDLIKENGLDNPDNDGNESG